MSKHYHVVSRQDTPDKPDSSALAGLLAKDGQILLPMLDLIANAQVAIDDLTPHRRHGTRHHRGRPPH